MYKACAKPILDVVGRKTNTMLGQKLLVVTIVLLYLSSIESGLVTKCKSDDSSCALKSAQALVPQFAAGLPEYNVKSVDPVTFKSIDASSNNLKLILTDVTVTGLKNCEIKKVKRDKAKNKLYVTLLCTCKLEGQYAMDGQLLITHITGNGPLHVALNRAEFILDIETGEKQKAGVTYWNIKGWKYTFNLRDNSTVVFENLFNGNDVLAEAARSVISENGNEIIKEVGPPVFKTVIHAIVQEVNAFFHKVPYQELSID